MTRAEIVILNSKDRKLILKDLTSMYGVGELPDVIFFCFNKKEKVYIATREIFEINREDLRINTFGMYYGTIMKDGFRPSLEGLHMMQDNIKKNILELDKEQFKAWITGSDLDVENEANENTYLILKYDNDFVGVGKLKNTSILNYLPKSRKLRKVIL